MANCINCGAPIKGDRCEYCGTIFADKYEGMLVLKGGNIPVYIEEYECTYDYGCVYTDIYGRLHRPISKPKRSFRCVER